MITTNNQQVTTAGDFLLNKAQAVFFPTSSKLTMCHNGHDYRLCVVFVVLPMMFFFTMEVSLIAWAS